MTDSENIAGKVIVITGASSGFGRGAALEFVKRGAKVVVAARRAELLNSLVTEANGTNSSGQIMAVATDVSKQDEVQNLYDSVMAAHGRIDVWINNAGAAAIGRFEDIPLADHVQVIQTDLMGTLYGSYLAMTLFRKQGSGILINTASALGKVPGPFYASYNASKHAIVGLSATLRQEIEQTKTDHIHVCTVMPMAMDTPFFQHAANYSGHEAVPIPPMYDPQKVIDTFIDLVQNPKAETIVGVAGDIAAFMHGIMPGVVEKIMGKEVQVVQMEQAKPAANKPGNLHNATEIDGRVYGGWAERMQA